MSRGRLKPRYLLLLAPGFLCLHTACWYIFRPHTLAATYPFFILAPLCALAAACWRVRTSTPRARLSWILFSVGLLLWNWGIWLSAWEDLVLHAPMNVAFFSDFVFFLYAVPILLAISSPAGGQRLPLFVWMDGIQAALTAYLTYITLFSVIPFTARSAQPISDHLIMQTYNVENFVLAIAATLRLLAQPEEGEERHFYQILCSFLWVYAVDQVFYNYSVVANNNKVIFALLMDFSFLVLTVATLYPFARKQEPAQVVPKKSLALFLDNASPIFYTLALSTLGITVMRPHFYVGVAAIAVALAVYGIRTITLQSRYMRTQQALQQTRDQLEEMSLKDGLTNVANRRCFDKVLESEWNRATRMQHPLSLLLIDIDYFKSLNDRYGHQRGDECLIDIAHSMQSVLIRSGDLLARYGGEEFAVILPATDRNGAELVADTMREAVRSLHIQNETSLGEYATVSIGIAVYEFPQAGSPAVLVRASDQALYQAKQNGRNRIEYFSMQALALC
jgi:diguanylate cyclase (GGDEF)-like protein